jgi:hypothetical protein
MTMKMKTLKQYAVILLLLLPVVFSCDTTKKQDPYLLINVNLDPLANPVSKTNKLYAVFYVNPDWTLPWLTLNSSSNTIVTPRMTIGDFPVFFEIVYDKDGNGIDSGDLYQGWFGKTDRTTDVLTPIVLTETDVMILNMDLDSNGLIP